MRKTTVVLGLAAALAAGPAALAASGLRGIMHSWKTSAREMHNMLGGRAAFEEPAIRATLEAYVADADRISAQVNSPRADAQDFKRRMLGFRADAQTALGHVGQRPTLAADVSRLMADCQSCHDVYN